MSLLDKIPTHCSPVYCRIMGSGEVELPQKKSATKIESQKTPCVCPSLERCTPSWINPHPLTVVPSIYYCLTGYEEVQLLQKRATEIESQQTLCVRPYSVALPPPSWINPHPLQFRVLSIVLWYLGKLNFPRMDLNSPAKTKKRYTRQSTN